MYKRRRESDVEDISCLSESSEMPSTSGQLAQTSASLSQVEQQALRKKLTRMKQLENTRERDAERRLKLDQEIEQLENQQNHLEAQILELQTYETELDDCGRGLNLEDLRQQMEAYKQRSKEAKQQLHDLDQQFSLAVADLLDVPSAELLTAEVSHQHRLQQLQMKRIEVERQLERLGVSSLDHSHKAKKVKTEAQDKVWDWLASHNSRQPSPPRTSGSVPPSSSSGALMAAASGSVTQPLDHVRSEQLTLA